MSVTVVERLVELGTHPQKDAKQNQITRLYNKIALFGILIITFYMLPTLYFRSLLATSVQVVTILVLGFTIFLNARHFFNLARVIGLLIGNFHIFAMVLLLGLDRGVDYFFSMVIILPLFVFTKKEIRSILLFASLTILLALLVHILSSQMSPIVGAPETLLTVLFFFSVIGSQATVFILVYYFYSESNRFEKSLKETNKKLHKLSETDPLTLLPNRRSFNRNLDREWGRGIRSKNPFAVIMIDVDHFKMFNDYYGHQEGDRCLVSFAEIILKKIREYVDFPGRYGGEEFIILLCNTNLDAAYIIAKRIHGEIMKLGIPNKPSKQEGIVTCSLGVASCIPSKDSGPEDLIRDADKALYRAKENGRNRVEQSS